MEPSLLARRLALMLLAVACAWAAAVGAEAAEHPRVFFRAEEMTTGRNLRGRVAITGSHCEEYALLIEWAEEQAAQPVAASLSDPELAQEAALTYAFLFQLSGERQYAERAVQLIKALITSPTGRSPAFDWPRLPATVATVLDWTYDRLSPEDRQRLLYDVLKRCIYVHDRKVSTLEEPAASAPYLRPLVFASLVLEGEPEAARYVPGWKELSRQALAECILPELGELTAQRAWLDRAGGLERQRDILECLEAWRRATGELPVARPAEVTTHFRRLGQQILYRLRPGFTLPGLGGDPPRAGGVPPELLYVLSHYEDAPVCRWLAETTRLARPAVRGSSEWLRDQRARILWLSKGTRRLSPEEGRLPLAGHFEDAGEVVVRGGWDLTGGDDVWCLFKVSPKEAGSYPYWNHLAIVRGTDPLAVEANVASPVDSPYSGAWYGKPGAQNTVIVDVGGFAQELFSLEGCVCSDGFTYARGRVRRSVAGPSDYELLRQLVVFPEGLLLVYDRAERGGSRPTWLLHTLDEPRLLGATRKVVGPAHGGVTESTDARGASWQTGRSQAHLRVLLPSRRLVRTIGGEDYEFWLEASAEDLWPTRETADGALVPYSPEELRRLEVGTWRVEVTPAEDQEVTEFLTVLAVGALGVAEPEASGTTANGKVNTTVTWQGRRYHATFEKDGSGSVEVQDAASGKTVIKGSFPAKGAGAD